MTLLRTQGGGGDAFQQVPCPDAKALRHFARQENLRRPAAGEAGGRLPYPDPEEAGQTHRHVG